MPISAQIYSLCTIVKVRLSSEQCHRKRQFHQSCCLFCACFHIFSIMSCCKIPSTPNKPISGLNVSRRQPSTDWLLWTKYAHISQTCLPLGMFWWAPAVPLYKVSPAWVCNFVYPIKSHHSKQIRVLYHKDLGYLENVNTLVFALLLAIRQAKFNLS